MTNTNSNYSEYKSKFVNFLNSRKNQINNYINIKFPRVKSIEVMTNKEDYLNRYKHFGAHLCVNKNHYIYLTFSKKDEYCERMLSLNGYLFNNLKRCKDDWTLLLLYKDIIYEFSVATIIKYGRLTCSVYNTYKVPLSVADNKYKANNKDIKFNEDFRHLGNVRYNINYDMHKKPITIIAEQYHYERRFDSIVKAYVSLTGTKLVNGKPEGKPVPNAAYKKSYVSFRRDIRANKLYLLNDKGEAFLVNIVDNSGSTQKLASDVTTSLLVNKYITNSDVVTSDQEINNKLKVGDKRQDLILDKVADKLVETADKQYSKADIFAQICKFGSNKHMMEVYTLSLYNKGLHKEAELANKLFKALNS